MIGLSGHWLSYIRGMERRKGDSGDCYSFLMCIICEKVKRYFDLSLSVL